MDLEKGKTLHAIHITGVAGAAADVILYRCKRNVATTPPMG